MPLRVRVPARTKGAAPNPNPHASTGRIVVRGGAHGAGAARRCQWDQAGVACCMPCGESRVACHLCVLRATLACCYAACCMPRCMLYLLYVACCMPGASVPPGEAGAARAPCRPRRPPHPTSTPLPYSELAGVRTGGLWSDGGREREGGIAHGVPACPPAHPDLGVPAKSCASVCGRAMGRVQTPMTAGWGCLNVRWRR
jgi:hypothetical protein